MIERETVIEVEPAVAVPAENASLIHWGPIWAGLLTAFGIFLLLSLTALAAGLQAAPIGEPADPTFGPQLASIITAVFLVVAFVAGGFVAAWSATLADPEDAVLHGFLVWALWLVVVFVLAALGAGQALGVFGQFAPQLAGEVDAPELLQLFRDAAWQTLFALVLAVASAIVGAIVATRDEVRRRLPRYRW